MQDARAFPCDREGAPQAQRIRQAHATEDTREEEPDGHANYIVSGVRFVATFRYCVCSCSGMGMSPLSERYPSGPEARALVNSPRYSAIPGITPACAFLT